MIAGSVGRKALETMPLAVPNLRCTAMVEGAGRRMQQERSDEVNAALIAFLQSLG